VLGDLAALSFEFPQRAIQLGDAGLKVCQMGLRFGGNDVGSVMLEENVVRAAGVTNCTTEEELRRIIRDAGFRPSPAGHLVPAVLSELSLHAGASAYLTAGGH
jgi:2-iminoacetate synthase ThiH